MDLSDILDPLNEPQRQAVCAPSGNLLVLAGAGSGKTRVLTHRIAYLIRIGEASTYNVMAVTFTNKAAREMRQRIEQILGTPLSGMWVGTFHGIAHRLLRSHWQEAKLPQTFQIIDSDDQYRLIRRSLKELDLDEKRWPPKETQWKINYHKDEGVRAGAIDVQGDLYLETFVRIYLHYEDLCQRNGLVDFAELLLRAQELWLQHPEVCRHYRDRFRHLLVDEFQDTNAIQYSWIRTLAADQSHTFVVGDDDQSIYGWRGAKVGNLQQFQRQFTEVELIRLEQNYRSTRTILTAANALIDNNGDRLGKNLWTAGEEGEPIRLYGAFNEIDEATYIVEQIERWVRGGRSRQEVAILYRSNAQSRVIEAALLQHGLPYRVYGGLRFYERAEIKDVLAYLRLCTNRDDDPSLERIINTPTRGIGGRTLDMLRDYARDHEMSLWRSAERMIAAGALTPRATAALQRFLDLIAEMSCGSEVSLEQQVDAVIKLSALGDHYKKEGREKGLSRIENMEELVSAAKSFVHGEDLEEGEEAMDDLTAFLAHAALEAGEGQAEEWEECVQLMSLHSAKGLEFPLVFIAGVEEGLFPHKRSLQEEGRLEEERRLCYVGVTRAKEELVLTYAEVRRLYGQENFSHPSRFLREIPEECVQIVRLQGVAAPISAGQKKGASFTTEAASTTSFSLGQQVTHPKFGEGTVVQSEGSGAQARLQVNFDRVGLKWLVIAYAHLQPL
ncbi:MAG: DNA helicase II [Gammaproteobacteria bacterium]|nr:DNA helicase II [Gammaproteobacteria bacterium]